jgi:hypothetical protein
MSVLMQEGAPIVRMQRAMMHSLMAGGVVAYGEDEAEAEAEARSGRGASWCSRTPASCSRRTYGS